VRLWGDGRKIGRPIASEYPHGYYHRKIKCPSNPETSENVRRKIGFALPLPVQNHEMKENFLKQQKSEEGFLRLSDIQIRKEKDLKYLFLISGGPRGQQLFFIILA